MNTRWDVLGLGVVAVDDLLYVDHYPAADSKVQVRSRRRDGGGLAATALVAAARLGAKVAYAGILGDDALSQAAIEGLEREGVDCSPVLFRADARPTHSTVIVDRSTGQRTIFFCREGVTLLMPDEVPEGLIAACRVLFLDYTTGEGGVRALELARARGIPVVADLEGEVSANTAALLWGVDHLIVSAGYAKQVTGEREPQAMVRALAGPQRACCAVTAGERGAWYAERDGPVRHQPALPVQVVDTTGCGDVFHGAYAACIARGEDVASAIEVAATAAGLKATRPGGRRGIPTWAEVEGALRHWPGRGSPASLGR